VSLSHSPHPVIFGCSGTVLTAEERAFFQDLQPLGFILFLRNCESPEQVKALIDSFYETTGREELLILVDQEGGRVTRLKPPHWRAAPAMARFAELYAKDAEAGKRACYLNARLLAAELNPLGFNVNCIPVLDLPVEGAHEIISDRALGTTPDQVIPLAEQVSQGLMDGGVLPVIKHIPGHGRALVDSHEALPVISETLEILEQSDFAPFQALHHLPLAMTAHAIYTALDDTRPATTSPQAIQYLREKIGYDGLLMSDDLSMKALQGDYQTRTEEALAAGCDVILHCNGKMEEMADIARGLEPLTDAASQRATRAFQALQTPRPIREEAVKDELDELLARL
jgi:beta-N-acetylhexosaminidase